ncbi:F0F1 ATP synthase subunit B [Mycoplasmopsis lipofaciens]|uniref:F0F1 ATP synthase subunit B n=1 Tax=Mycoplasmopsis lipofaciens TaxID=114884 RepID=UPI00068E09BB|nr:F0F1 ATP synthase subunit B [Mycoplasmopsis lipofaciens]
MINNISNIKVNYSKSPSLSETISEKFNKIFPSIPMMISTLIALILVILILHFLLYKPLKKAIKARQDYIQNNLDEAKKTNDLSKNKINEANQKLVDAHQQAKTIIIDAKAQAEKVANQYTTNAKNESKRILEEANIVINQQREALLEDSKNQIAKAAAELSRQILKKEVSKRTENQIIDNFLKEKD